MMADCDDAVLQAKPSNMNNVLALGENTLDDHTDADVHVTTARKFV
jgi:hypothetical protein